MYHLTLEKEERRGSGAQEAETSGGSVMLALGDPGIFYLVAFSLAYGFDDDFN